MSRRAPVVALLLALALPAGACRGNGSGRSTNTCVAPARPPLGSVVALEDVFAAGIGFRRPIGAWQRPGDDERWYVAEQRGIVYTFLPGDTVATVVFDLDAEIDSGPNEAGLLGLAFHPDVDANGRLFVSYTADGSPLVSHIAELTLSPDGLTALGPASILLSVDQPYENHNGGDIHFGPDGYLYISLGDGGSGGDPLESGQDVNSLLGKMLRIDVDAGSPYAIPPDNPFAAGGGAPEIYAWGLRNVWRFSFDRVTGALWAGDVGQNEREEIDVIELGGNYGWNEKEGFDCYDAPSPCDDPQWIDPVVDYGHDDGRSVTGGYVYRGAAIPALAGAYVFGDYESGRIWALRPGSNTPEQLLSSGLSISSFAEGNDGELYVLDLRSLNGRMYRMVPAGDVGTGNLPVLLSDTGCVKESDARKPIDALIPYDVNVPLWSDGATKRRWLSLPEDGTIAVEEDGDLTLPVGTVLVKEFSLGGKRIETRLFVRHEDGGWGGYTYEWDDAESDATLIPNGKSEPIGEQVWLYPSGSQCLDCHTEAAGRSLGLELGQLNRDFPAGSGRDGNQLEYLRDREVFATDPGAAGGLAAFPAPDDGSASIETRARAYLHVNCSNCHRPGGTTQAEMDLRFERTLAEMNVCDVDPLQGDLGYEGAKLLVPGDAKASLLAIRMHWLGEGRMPDVASSVVDRQGLDLVTQWIESLTACP